MLPTNYYSNGLMADPPITQQDTKESFSNSGLALKSDHAFDV